MLWAIREDTTGRPRNRFFLRLIDGWDRITGTTNRMDGVFVLQKEVPVAARYWSVSHVIAANLLEEAVRKEAQPIRQYAVYIIINQKPATKCQRNPPVLYNSEDVVVWQDLGLD